MLNRYLVHIYFLVLIHFSVTSMVELWEKGQMAVDLYQRDIKTFTENWDIKHKFLKNNFVKSHKISTQSDKGYKIWK